MAQLKSIIGSILRDIIAAQHAANLYSLALSDNYGTEGKTRDFQLPSVAISDLELELHYGVVDDSEEEKESNINFSKLRDYVRNMSRVASGEILNTSISFILVDDNTRPLESKQFFQKLQEKGDTYLQFKDFLFRNFVKEFNGNLYEVIDREKGCLLIQTTCEKMMKVVKYKFLYDTDLNILFAGMDGEALRRNLEKAIRTDLEQLITEFAEDENFIRTKAFPTLDVAVTADELRGLPEEAIHTFKLKITPTDRSVSQLENGDLDDFDMLK